MNLLEERKYILENLDSFTRRELEEKQEECKKKYEMILKNYENNPRLFEDSLFNAGVSLATYKIALKEKPAAKEVELELSKDNSQYCFMF